MVTTVRKEEGEILDRDLLKDKSVQHVLKTIHGSNASDEQLAAFETAMIDLAMYDLHLFKDDIRKGIKKYQEAHVKKFYRAYTKANLARIKKGLLPLDPVGKDGRRAGMQFIEAYEREDGTPVSEHWRQLRRGEEQTATTREKIAEERAQQDPVARTVEGFDFDVDVVAGPGGQDRALAGAKYSLGAMGGLAETAVDPDSHFRRAADRFFREDDYTQGAVSVADYFTKSGGRLGTIAAVARDYGPMASMRMVNAYYRYSGYDVPILEDRQGRKKNEFGDKIKDGESLSQTRDWAITNLKSRLPGQEAQDAGIEPPSEGYILNHRGEVIAHGVGRGNDHYLPFSNKHMKQIRKGEGVEWVRRRMYGGPTVEDLYSAMSAGADRFTVVSNAGEFTMEVSPRAHGLGLDTIDVVTRYQQMLGRSEQRNHKGYTDAMRAMVGENPLLFRMDKAPKKGDWSDRPDPVGPKSSLFDELKSLFTTSRDEERRQRAERQRQFGPGGVREPERADALSYGFSGARRGESIREAYERRKRLGHNVANQAAQAYRKAGLSVPEDIQRDLRGQSGGEAFPVTTRQSEQRAAAVEPPADFVRQMEEQEARRVQQQREQSRPVHGAFSDDANITTAPAPSQGRATVREVFADYDDGISRLDDLGYSVDSSVGDPDGADHIMSNIHFFDDETWEEVRSDPIRMEELREGLDMYFWRKR